jgi:kynurenine formamidase
MCVPGCQEAVRSALSRRGFFRGAAGAVAGGFAAAAVAPPADAAPAVAPARRFSTAVDLTHTMSPDFPTFFGEPGVTLEKKFDFKKDGFNLNLWRLNEHAGTHLDAPIHFSEAGDTAAMIPAATLVVPLAVVDVSAKAAQSPDYLLSREDLAAWERRNRRLPDNCCVAMHSGWGKHVGDHAKFIGKDAAGVLHFPGFDPDAVAWLMKERKVAGIAVDTLSLDHGPSKDFKVHTTWLPSGRWGLENVANLDQVPAAGATLVVGIAKVKDATGGPARLFALV